MQIQILRMQTIGLTEEQLKRYRSMLQLGIGELEGLFSAVFTASSGGFIEGVCFWDTEADVERFRHSELYARLQMCPAVEGVEDRDMEMKVRVLAA